MKDSEGEKLYTDCLSKVRMRDQAAIVKFSRYEQGGGLVGYFFGDTTVVVRECIDTNSIIRLLPIRGDQVAYGQWIDLEENEVAAYCKLLEEKINGKESI